MQIILDVKVIPQARRQLLKPDNIYDLRCYVNSPPEDNKANREVIEFLAESLGISKNSLTLIAGATSRIKRISVEGFASKQDIFKRLNLEVQDALF